MKKSKKSKASRSKLSLATAGAILIVAYLLLPDDSAWRQAATWQHMASPGELSRAHANLERDCAACHTSVSGVDATKCALCHAANQSLLQRQPTAFHASIGTCKPCHPEHRGLGERPTAMDHEAVARIGLKALESATDEERSGLHVYLSGWTEAKAGALEGLPVTPLEAVLACEACHANEDQHFGLFGADCAQCHATDKWTLPLFRHPSPQSRDCAQCHQAPPSHYMGHFKMISATIARKPRARVDQCFECHRTTAWTDIPGVGHYKHH